MNGSNFKNDALFLVFIIRLNILNIPVSIQVLSSPTNACFESIYIYIYNIGLLLDLVSMGINAVHIKIGVYCRYRKRSLAFLA